jgi:hypothetical protein
VENIEQIVGECKLTRDRGACVNCGLPGRVRAKVKLKAENSFRRDSVKTLVFCGQECAIQTAFLQLKTVSTRESITRYLAGKPITLAQFRELVPVETSNVLPEHSRGGRPVKWATAAHKQREYRRRQKNGSTVTNPPMQLADSTGPKNAKNEEMTGYPHLRGFVTP